MADTLFKRTDDPYRRAAKKHLPTAKPTMSVGFGATRTRDENLQQYRPPVPGMEGPILPQWDRPPWLEGPTGPHETYYPPGGSALPPGSVGDGGPRDLGDVLAGPILPIRDVPPPPSVGPADATLPGSDWRQAANSFRQRIETSLQPGSTERYPQVIAAIRAYIQTLPPGVQSEFNDLLYGRGTEIPLPPDAPPPSTEIPLPPGAPSPGAPDGPLAPAGRLLANALRGSYGVNPRMLESLRGGRLPQLNTWGQGWASRLSPTLMNSLMGFYQSGAARPEEMAWTLGRMAPTAPTYSPQVRF